MDENKARIIQLRLRQEQIVQRIHELAEAGQIAFSDHAYDQMEARGITDVMALRTVQRGDLKGDIEPGQNLGEWKAKIVERVRGAREIGVVTILIRNPDFSSKLSNGKIYEQRAFLQARRGTVRRAHSIQSVRTGRHLPLQRVRAGGT